MEANWIGVGGHVVTYPLRQVDSSNVPSSHEERLQDLVNWHPPARANLKGAYCGAGVQIGGTGSPAMTRRTNGSESFSEAFTVSPWSSPL